MQQPLSFSRNAFRRKGFSQASELGLTALSCSLSSTSRTLFQLLAALRTSSAAAANAPPIPPYAALEWPLTLTKRRRSPLPRVDAATEPGSTARTAPVLETRSPHPPHAPSTPTCTVTKPRSGCGGVGSSKAESAAAPPRATCDAESLLRKSLTSDRIEKGFGVLQRSSRRLAAPPRGLWSPPAAAACAEPPHEASAVRCPTSPLAGAARRRRQSPPPPPRRR